MADESASIDELGTDTELGEREIRLAPTYREQYADEISDAIRENTRPAAEWVELYPFVRVPASGR